MLRSFYSGVSGLKVNQAKLDVIGNNIANVGTTSFKSSRVRFKDMISQNVTESASPGTSLGGMNAKQVGLGVQISGIDTLVGQGTMQPTARDLDVAIDGEGYFVVAKGATTATASLVAGKLTGGSAGTEISYTRDGALIKDNLGNLVTSDGARVMGYALAGNVQSAAPQNASTSALVPLSIPDKITDLNGKVQNVTSFTIAKDGVISAVLADGSVSEVGQIAMATFSNPEGLKKTGDNLYQSTSNSGTAQVRSGIVNDEDKSSGYGDMLQKVLEMSNVDLSEQFTDMIIAERAFQASGKSITTGDEILQDLIGLKR
ncbi:flagellar hook-basal body complex protein [Clostridium psychrophilum]|uniref:flagellar hook-basal body complex protein n=1 Tax=Clostridium psychrophilum TaxID=132926 RepID=UPI001C0AB438|nr:flagellar hook-basal body complex protein [Clostridium psychrophilum]MBU3180637.1 flagellar hook-basal body complex protein [Clostridium psychrophilum]